MNRIENPYRPEVGCRWLRGNLHAHTTRSDGKIEPQGVIDAYAGLGYDFLMISDHDVFLDSQSLKTFDSRGLTLLPGNEITAGGPHILHVGAGTRIEPDPDRQKVFNAIAAEKVGFGVVCHPNWQAAYDHSSIQMLKDWLGYAGLEIYNGLIDWSSGSSYATNKWDMLLGSGRRVWGFANDDSHSKEDIGRGWNMVCCASTEPDAILKALANGNFYASTGVLIETIHVEGNTIRIETANAEKIVARTHAPVDNRLTRFAEVKASSIEVEIPPDSINYVRFECWGRGEEFAWTQPFFLHEDDI